MSQDDRQLPHDVEQLQAMIAQREDAHAVAIAARDAAIVEQTETIVEHRETIAQHATIIAAQHETIEQQLQKLDGPVLNSPFSRQSYCPRRRQETNGVSSLQSRAINVA